MAYVLKPGDKIGNYLIIEEGSPGPAKKYKATDGENSEVFEVTQYTSPAPSSEGWGSFLQEKKRLLEVISCNPKLKELFLEAPNIILDFLVRKQLHHELLLVTKPSPRSLGEILKRNELSGAARFDLALKIAEALGTFHSAGVIFVAIDPWSIGVRDNGSITFLEFICARLADELRVWSGVAPGFQKRFERAPELREGEEVTTASDIYALGAVVFELLIESGSFQQDGGTRRDEPELPWSFFAGMPDFDQTAVIDMLEKCLSDDPAIRPTADEVAKLLGRGVVTANAEVGLKIVPRWLAQPLQALAFWVAYQNEIYRHHLLPEGAIVAELTRLVDAEIGLEKILVREPLYRSLLNDDGRVWKTLTRADLAVKCKIPGSASSLTEAVFEIKRGSATETVIDEDLIALAQLKQLNSGVRAFLVVVSQARCPDRWVSSNGTAELEAESIPVTLEDGSSMQVHARVRRVVKAAASFRSKDTATYCCLIEVF